MVANAMPAYVEQPNGCWHYAGYIKPNGYGQVGRNGNAHRASYEFHYGPIPSGTVVNFLCHTADESCTGGADCMHRRCVNPAHLEAVSRRVVNVERSRGLAALEASRTHCPRGHSLNDPEHAYNRPDRLRGRQCATCIAERSKTVNDASRDRAHRHGRQWTGADISIVATRPDLTRGELASLLGRTVQAVSTMRSRLHTEPSVLPQP